MLPLSISLPLTTSVKSPEFNTMIYCSSLDASDFQLAERLAGFVPDEIFDIHTRPWNAPDPTMPISSHRKTTFPIM